jgi:hypothetical protein
VSAMYGGNPPPHIAVCWTAGLLVLFKQTTTRYNLSDIGCHNATYFRKQTITLDYLIDVSWLTRAIIDAIRRGVQTLYPAELR